MLVFRDTETKGRGIFAQQEFAKGDLLDYFEVRNSTDVVDTEIYAAGIIFFTHATCV